MIPFLFFLLFLLVWLAVAFALTTVGMNGAWSREEPAAVRRRLQLRNRLILLVVLLVLVLTAVMESLIPDVSTMIQDLQYSVGDATGADPVLVYETANGTLSWGLYLAVLAGTFGGLLLGTFAAIRRYPILRGLSAGSLV